MLEAEVLDLRITNRAKVFYIDQLKKEREGFTAERQEYVTQLMSFNRRGGRTGNKVIANRIAVQFAHLRMCKQSAKSRPKPSPLNQPKDSDRGNENATVINGDQ